MRCRHCPLYQYFESEEESYSNCGLFGDDWQNRLQYTDHNGDVVGCYVEKCFIEKYAKSAGNLISLTI